MKQKTIAFLLTLCILFSISPLLVSAVDTTLKTSVPANHIIYLDVKGNGTILIDGKQYSKTTNIPIQRHSEPFVEILAAKDYYIRSVTYNQENITHLFNNGEWTMPKIETDVSISVVFVKDSGNPQTGDTFNPWMIVLLTVSILGLIVCILNIRKSKLI